MLLTVARLRCGVGGRLLKRLQSSATAAGGGKTRRRALPQPLTLTPTAEKFLRILHGSRQGNERGGGGGRGSDGGGGGGGGGNDCKGFLLSIDQAPNNMHMVFSFDFIHAEGVKEHSVGGGAGSLMGAEKVPFAEDGSLALYIDSTALMKVLGATVDYDQAKSSLVILNSDGEEVSPET